MTQSMRIDVSDVLAGLRVATAAARTSGMRGLSVGGEHVLGVSNAQVPHEEGDLARSGAVSQDESTGRTAVSYDTDYAVRQHEDMTMQHDAGRNAKYLERAVNSERETVLQIVATAIKGAIK